MPNDAYTVLSNLELFHNWVTLLLFWKLKKDLEFIKLSKYWYLKETGANYKLVFLFKDNSLQNTLGKIKK